MSLFSLLNSGSRALATAGHGVSVASNNVANANTRGYARETLSLGAKGTLRASGLLLGQGVQAEQVLSAYDSFSQESVFGRLGDHAYSSGRATSFDSIEASFLEGGGGSLGAVIDGFFQSFSELELEPGQSATRLAVLAAGGVMAELFNHSALELSARSDDANARVKSLTTRANQLFGQVASLNTQIVELEAGGQGAHDLRAQRTAALEELSALGPTRINEDAGGAVSVFFANHSVVEGGTARTLSTVDDPSTGLAQVNLSMGGTTLDITAGFDGGTIGASLEIRDTVLAGLMTELDELAFGLATEVNALHSAGFGLDGVTGRDFFATPATVDGAAASLAIDASIAGNADAIAAASTAAGTPGDNTNATAIAELADSLLMASGTQTFNQAWSGLISGLGHDAAAARSGELRSSAELSAAFDVRDAASGVSLEEEALDLLRFQDSYKAAARVMSTANEMLDELLNLFR